MSSNLRPVERLVLSRVARRCNLFYVLSNPPRFLNMVTDCPFEDKRLEGSSRKSRSRLHLPDRDIRNIINHRLLFPKLSHAFYFIIDFFFQQKHF
jgi:hypothetical protein